METVNRTLATALDLLQQGNDELAEKEFANAAAACCSAFGEADIVTARTLAHLARVCASRGKVDVAVSMYERILCTHEALPVPSNSDHAVALYELATLREKSGSREDPDVLRRRADGIMAELNARIQAAEAKRNAEAEASSDDQGSSEDEDQDESEGGESSASDGSGDTSNNC